VVKSDLIKIIQNNQMIFHSYSVEYNVIPLENLLKEFVYFFLNKKGRQQSKKRETTLSHRIENGFHSLSFQTCSKHFFT
jgi:hypothetical protein